MSAEMYSTSPSLTGGGVVIASAWWASNHLDQVSVWPYVGVGIGYLLFLMAFSITSSQRLAGLLAACAVLCAIPSALSAWWLWATPYDPLAITCIGVGSMFVLWALIAAAWFSRAEKNRRPPDDVR